METESTTYSQDRNIRHIATRWSLVKRYREGAQRTSELAADELARIYLVPLYVWLVRKGHPPEDARDALQDFMVHMFGKESLKKARPENGRLRGFLLTSLRNFVNSRHRRNNAQRRGGGAVHFSIDWLSVEAQALPASGEASPEAAYDRGLAGSLVEVAFARVEAYYAKTGQVKIFRSLVSVLEEDMPPGRYQEISDELGVSAAALRVASFRLRKRFAGEIRAAARQAFDLPDGPELEAEIQAVFGS